MTVEQLQTLIDRNKAALIDYTEHGTECMSKTGVKWCKSVTRDMLKRLRAQLQDAKLQSRNLGQHSQVVPDRQA